MNDFLKTMGQFGMEGLGYEPAEMTLEEEMNAEIAMEAELDEAYAQMDFANIVAGTSQAEAILTAMAEREVGLESNAGRDAAVIYGEFGLEGFGMEAVKDVVARKAYSGIASLKALINTCISWLKQLLGIHTASKKIFSGLNKKAKAMKKQLGKVQSKVSEKLKRDMPDYVAALDELARIYEPAMRGSANAKNSFNLDETVVDILTNPNLEADISNMESRIEDVKRSSERLSDGDLYDAKDTNEYEGSECYNRVRNAVVTIETYGRTFKTEDIIKNYDKSIKNLEKVRREIDKRAKNEGFQVDPNVSRFLNKTIEGLNRSSAYQKKVLKLIVKVSDDALTMAKGVYASLV